uniref:Si:dkey-32e6.3 n=1 Tax=Cyprinus carpio TaxID=7962 RepID=A0A8C2ICC5_CYPCA
MTQTPLPSITSRGSSQITYYSQFGRVAGFTTVGPGRRFRKVLEEHLELLRWPSDLPADKELSVKGEDGKLYHWILPSFFQMLQDLASQGLEFSILFRTFGSDLPRVLNAVRRAVEQGSHPLFPNLPALKLRVNVTAGHIKCSSKGATLIRGEDHVSTRDGERQVYQYLSSAEGLGGFQDNFDWWAQNTYSILGGKPLWIDPFDHKVQHIFIDDNIRQNDEDTIVHPKVLDVCFLFSRLTAPYVLLLH